MQQRFTIGYSSQVPNEERGPRSPPTRQPPALIRHSPRPTRSLDDDDGTPGLEVYDMRLDIEKREISQLRSKKLIHAISLLLFLCFFILWWFSYPDRWEFRMLGDEDVGNRWVLLRKVGLKEEIIAVCMYDDITMRDMNPRPGDDVYCRLTKVREWTNKGNGHTVGSHVMEYGNKNITSDPSSVNFPTNSNQQIMPIEDATDLSMWGMYQMEDEPEKKKEFLKQIKEEESHRNRLKLSLKLIGAILYGPLKGPSILNSERSDGLPIVDDWECLRRAVRLFEFHCGSLIHYGPKHLMTNYGLKLTQAFANICNYGTSQDSLEEACLAACSGYDHGQFHPSIVGYTVASEGYTCNIEN